MKHRKLKTTLLSSAAIFAVAAVATSNSPVAAQSVQAELNQIVNLVDQLAADFKSPGKPTKPVVNANSMKTLTPIKHLVVIFNENRSFDHYFGTYPQATNPPGEPNFTAAKNTPIPNNYIASPEVKANLLIHNPNLNLANNVAEVPPVLNSSGAITKNGTAPSIPSVPFRLDRTQANTSSQSHNYTSEQKAFNNGAGDLFPVSVGAGGFVGANGVVTGVEAGTTTGVGAPAFNTKAQTMGYYDGNTITAIWNYAQNYAMSDNAWSDTYGPSTPGLLNMFAGNTNGIIAAITPGGSLSGNVLADGTGITPNGNSLIGDVDPTLDVCSPQSPAAFALAAAAGTPLTSGGGTTVMSTANNIGAMLSAANVPWGSFVGGFDLSANNPANGAVPATTGCTNVTFANGAPVFTAGNPGRVSVSAGVIGNTTSTVNGATMVPVSTDAPLIPIPDYVQHHVWFQYFTSTANQNHTLPASIAEIGHDGPANHAYDFNELEAAISAGNNPAVAFVKMPAFQDSHPGNSDPLDEQTGLVNLINFLQEQPDWKSTAVILAYDDSDGWYDHQFTTPTQSSFSSADALNGTNTCGTPGQTQPMGVNGKPANGRCGPGMRQPFLVISPWAQKNHIDHTFITQASIPQFIEDNWLDGAPLGGGSFDRTTGSIMSMFNFHQFFGTKLILNADGTVKSSSSIIE
jgi:phospholipase C